MNIAIIIGTRPEIIKMAPIIRELERRNRTFFVLHTGQHYSYNLDRVFIEQLNLPKSKHNLHVRSDSSAVQTGKMLTRVGEVLQQEKPDIVLVEGDTNSVLAGALAAVKLHIKVGHVEAGLRSYDRSMPEEINRILVDHCSDLLFAPTENAMAILHGEGIPGDRIFMTGNTIVDSVYQNLEMGRDKTDALNMLGLQPKKYFLATIHRQENVDNKVRFASILEGLEHVAEKFKTPVIYPIHPRSLSRMRMFDLEPRKIKLIDPVDYFSFLQLESSASLVLTDSGGVQEEACILGVPCVTLRDNTERPETIEIGSNVLAGTLPEKVLKYTELMLGKELGWKNPFGDGKAGERIVDIITGR
ncbi:non-hydrolyzing UDP-N-acetylglucosamine 2-epimerase [Chloroflexota bacterium]